MLNVNENLLVYDTAGAELEIVSLGKVINSSGDVESRRILNQLY